ncbi:MAG: MscL family protein [Candidatus Nomurabacteria bacterium]
MKRLERIKKLRGLSGFREFLRNQGIITLAIGFILGGAISKFVSSLVADIIYPIMNGLMGGVNDLNSEVYHIGKTSIFYGRFLNNGIDFIVIALVVYAGVKLMRIDQEQIGKMDIGKINSLNTTMKK